MRQHIQSPVSLAVTERPPCVARWPDFLLRSQAVEQERRTDERRTLGRLAALGGGVLLLAVLGLLGCPRPGPSACVGCRTGVASGTCRRATQMSLGHKALEAWAGRSWSLGSTRAPDGEWSLVTTAVAAHAHPTVSTFGAASRRWGWMGCCWRSGPCR